MRGVNTVAQAVVDTRTMKSYVRLLAACIVPLVALGAVGAGASLLSGCSSSDGGGSSSDPQDDASTGSDTGDTGDTDAGSDAAKGQPKDAGVDVAKTPAWAAGEEGKSCADACKALGKTCAVACTDPRSCGGQDTAPPPYAGYACYYYDNGKGFRSNEGRALVTCSDVATTTWDHYANDYTLGDYVGGNPVSCCCE